jgi:hypothetical protein
MARLFISFQLRGIGGNLVVAASVLKPVFAKATVTCAVALATEHGQSREYMGAGNDMLKPLLLLLRRRVRRPALGPVHSSVKEWQNSR